MKAVRPVIASNEGPFPPNEVVRIAQHFRKEKDGNEEKISDFTRIF